MLSSAVIEKDKSSDSIGDPGQVRESVTWEDWGIGGLLGSAPAPVNGRLGMPTNQMHAWGLTIIGRALPVEYTTS